AVAVLDPEAAESGGEARGTAGDVSERGPAGAVSLERHDPAVTVDPLPLPGDHPDTQREILHRALEHCAPRSSVVLRRAHQPRMTPRTRPSTSRAPARRVWTNARAANQSGQIGKPAGGSAGFGWENGVHTVASFCSARSASRAAIGNVPVPTS